MDRSRVSSVCFYSNSKKNSLLSVIEDMDNKLSRYSELSVVKKYFDGHPESIEKDEKFIKMIKCIRRLHEDADRDVRMRVWLS